MNENILKEAKDYVEHITSLNTSKAFLRGFICGLKGIVNEDELDTQIAYELDVPNFKAGYFDGVKFYTANNKEKLEALLKYATEKFDGKINNSSMQNPVETFISNLNSMMNTKDDFIDLSKINEKVESQDISNFDLKTLTEETNKLHNEALDISKQINSLNFPTLNPLVETVEEPKKDSEKLKEYSNELDKLLSEAKGNRNIDDILNGK